MSMADFIEWMTVLLMAPIATFTVFFFVITLLYVYIDAEERSRSRLFASALAFAVGFSYWPISFIAYIAGTVILDRRRQPFDADRTNNTQQPKPV